MAWEPISGYATFATFIGTEEGLVAMAMHSVGLTLVPEETGSGREMEVLAGEDLAAVRLQVGIHEFASKGKVVSGAKGLGNEMGAYS